MRTIKILDTTLRDGEQAPGCSMHINEKLEIAESLEALKVDIIEAGFPVISEGDFKSVKEIAKLIKNCTIAGLCRAVEKDIDVAYDALKYSANPRLHLFIATSPIHLKYKLNLTEDEVLERIKSSINYAKKYLAEIQFSFEDACRTPLEFLTKAAQTAIDAGAKIINIPDTVGYITPLEISDVFSYLKNNLKGIENIDLSTHNHDDLGLAVANSLSAVQAGATQVEGTFTGIGERAGNTALEEVIMALKTRKNYYGCDTNVNTKAIYRASKLISSIIGVKIPPNKAVIGGNAFSHEAGIHQHGIIADRSTYEIMSAEDVGITTSGILLGKHSGKHALASELKKMGYDFSPELLNEIFEKFKDLADRKKTITIRDIEALLPRTVRHQSNKTYTLEAYEANSYMGGAYAVITLKSNDTTYSERESGDGPVDAAFKAITNIIGRDSRLLDFSIHSVTEGKDALGETLIKLEMDGRTASGRGVSTDVLESAILAYINAVNKLLEEENEN